MPESELSSEENIPGPFYAGVLYDPVQKKFEIFSTNSVMRYTDDANSDMNYIVEHGRSGDFVPVYVEEVSKDSSAAGAARREELKKLPLPELEAFIRIGNPELKSLF